MTAAAVIGPEAERERIFAADSEDEAATAARLAPLIARAGASEKVAASASSRAKELFAVARDDAAAVELERRQRERRRLACEWDLRRTAPPIVFEFADALDVHAASLRMDRVEAQAGTPRGPAAVRCQQLARELREDVAILPAGAMGEALARIRAEVSLMLLGVPGWQTRFLLPFLTEGETP